MLSPPSSPKSRRASEGSRAGAVCVVLAAGFSQLEQELASLAEGEVPSAPEPSDSAPSQCGGATGSFAGGQSASGAGPQGGLPAAWRSLSSLAGTPKALLPVAGTPMLDHWWGYLSQNRAISEIFIVTNAIQYKHFERWATARGLPVSRVVNSGATAPCRSRGVTRDVELGLQRARQAMGPLDDREVIVFAGDTLFFKDFDLERILAFRAAKGGSLLLYYGRPDDEQNVDRGMCQVDPISSSVLAFAEKPARGSRGHNFPFVSPLFYILSPEAWAQIPGFNAAQIAGAPGGSLDGAATEAACRPGGGGPLRTFSFGCFVEHAVEKLKLPFWGMRMPGAFFLIGASAGVQEYMQLNSCFSAGAGTDLGSPPRVVRTKTYARVGLMGNPSDGFNGKTIAVTVRNFWASVELWQSEKLRLLPHPLYDPSSFSGLADLHFIGRREGYYGGTRLLMATCKKFQELCTASGIALPRKNFTARYDTNVPRQVGLAGSSAIVTSLFHALMEFYGLSTEHIPLVRQPSFVLSVEQELGIQAGLQDRVVQVYGGLVYMDFCEEYMAEHGHGRYERLSRAALDWFASLPLFIAYEADPSDSGKIHSTVRARWDAKDPEVLKAMAKFAHLAGRAKTAIEDRDHALMADLMDENFDTRRALFGDACLGQKNLRMIEICRGCSCAAKFPGSGGAVIGLCRPGKETLDSVRRELEAEYFVFCPLDPVAPEP